MAKVLNMKAFYTLLLITCACSMPLLADECDMWVKSETLFSDYVRNGFKLKNVSKHSYKVPEGWTRSSKTFYLQNEESLVKCLEDHNSNRCYELTKTPCLDTTSERYVASPEQAQSLACSEDSTESSILSPEQTQALACSGGKIPLACGGMIVCAKLGSECCPGPVKSTICKPGQHCQFGHCKP